MNGAKQKTWNVWLLIVGLYLSFVTIESSRRLCGKKISLPPHTKSLRRSRKVNHVTLLCDKGYYFGKAGNKKDIRCSKFRRLSFNKIPKCKGCGDLTPPENGSVRYTSDAVGSVAIYSCNIGYRIKGSRKQRKCRRNLRWSGGKTKVKCIKNRCHNPGNITINNGNVTFSDKLFEEFTTISFECDNDYELIGDEDIVCLNGHWSSQSFPFCKRKRCPKPDIPDNGRYFGSDYFLGSTVEFFCASGFNLHGSKRRTCQEDKTWNGTAVVCDDGRSYCVDPGTPEGAIKTGRSYNLGDIIQYRCKHSLKLYKGSLKRICLKNRTWSGEPPKCVDEYFKVFPSINETADLLSENFVNNLLQTTCSGANVTCPKRDTRARALNLKYKEGLDLIFVLDTSSSIREQNFDIAREFIKDMVKKFGIDARQKGDGTHIACVTFGSRAEKQFSFNDASVNTVDKAKKEIDKIPYTRGGTATTLALDLVRRLILPSARKGSKKALFLITDGESNIGGSPEKLANDLKNKDKVEIYVVGIGKRVRDKSLKELASNPKYVFAIKSYDDLNKVKRKIITKDYSACGKSYFAGIDSRARIVGGHKAKEKDWPWIVRIFVNDKQVCGGTLINKESVLTAAHCFHVNTKPSDVMVMFQDKVPLKITELHVNQNYRSNDYRHDIALIKIKKLKRFTRKKQAVCLPRDMDIKTLTKNDSRMYAVGWGGTTPVKPKEKTNDDIEKNPFKQVSLPFKSNKFCEDKIKEKREKEKKDKWYFNKTTQFCAGDVSGKNDTCHGDSGGPSMVNRKHPKTGEWSWFQVGIISWGIGCSQVDEVGFYTKVSAYFDWIDQKTK